MSDTAQKQSQTQSNPKSQYSGQSNTGNTATTGKVGNNIVKDEPLAQRRTGGMADEAASSPASSKLTHEDGV